MAIRILFESLEHRAFYHDMLVRVHNTDSYHRALFYTLGINDDTRRHVMDLFDFEDPGIRPEGFDAGWQTSGSRRITLLAFNLWNGYSLAERPELSTPYHLFDDAAAPYMWQAVQLRYPHHTIDIDKPVSPGLDR